MINEDRNSQKEAILRELSFTPSVNISNHIQSMNTMDLAREVVKKLDLDVEYVKRASWQETKYNYGEAPVSVEFVDCGAEGGIEFDLEVIDGSKCSITNLHYLGKLMKENFKGKTSDIINLPFGQIRVRTNDAFTRSKKINTRVRKLSLHNAALKVRGSLNIAQHYRSSSIISMSCRAPSRLESKLILEKFIEAYAEKCIKEYGESLELTGNFLSQRLTLIESELNEIDQDIAQFKSNSLSVEDSHQVNMALSEAQSTRGQIEEIENQLEIIRYMKNFVETDKGNMIPLTLGLKNEIILKQIASYNELLGEKNAKLELQSFQNPKARERDKLMAIMSENIKQTLEHEMEHLKGLQEKFLKKLEISQNIISNNPLKAQYLISISRQQKVKEDLFLFLLQKREENQMTSAVNNLPIQIIEAPDPNMAVLTPQPRTIWAIAFMVALLMPTAMLYVREALFGRIYFLEDFDTKGLQPIGVMRIANKKGQPMIAYEMESYMAKQGNCKVVNVTEIEKSGKAYAALVQLSRLLTELGHKVLIIDLDYRTKKPVDRQVIKCMVTLDDYLNDYTCNLNCLITVREKVSRIEQGFSQLKCNEIIRHPRLTDLISQCRAAYDYVFIKAPELQNYPDAYILSLLTDCTLILMKKGKIRQTLLPAIERKIREKSASGIGGLLYN